MNTYVGPAELDRIASDLETKGSYEGYVRSRLFLGQMGLYLCDRTHTLHVPDGPWYVSGHENRRGVPGDLLDLEVPDQSPRVDDELSTLWKQKGLLLDQYGRPIHPNWHELMADERIGLPTDLGFFYRYGPNATVDPIVFREHDHRREFLLIKRRKGGQWAFPGGFEDRSDASKAAAARREAGEETGLWDIGGTDEEIFSKRSCGRLTTLHAWTENTVVLIRGDQEYLFDTRPVAGDDAIDVGWFTASQIAELDIFGSHRQYLDIALREL